MHRHILTLSVAIILHYLNAFAVLFLQVSFKILLPFKRNTAFFPARDAFNILVLALFFLYFVIVGFYLKIDGPRFIISDFYIFNKRSIYKPRLYRYNISKCERL